MKKSTETPFDMVVVGATGDLSRRKLLPALYYLHKYRAIAGEGRIFAVSRRAGSRQSFLEQTGERARRHVEPSELSEEAWQSFTGRLDFVQVSATEPQTYGSLKQLLDEAPDRVRVFYLATAPDLYGPISRAIATAGLATPATRIVLEKPIGHDLDSARDINASVGEVFQEHQIYRIDHYLGKETVQNLMVLRFGNALLEPMWRADRIDHVQITVAETLGVEGRGGYYDDSGALRDMIQNHLLQLFCLVAMEAPARLDQDAIREEKIKVLRSLRPFAPEDVAQKTVRGQYRAGAIGGEAVVGYLEEPGIGPESTTETFVALKAEIDNWRWAGVPFYLRTGKRMTAKVSEIIIQFKQVPHLLFRDQAGAMQPNRLVIRLQPDEGVRLSMMTKVPGPGMRLKREFLNLNLADRSRGRSLQAYERLLLDVVRGFTTLFMHRDEVEEAWRFIEPILAGWDARGGQPRYYGAGTWGPPESIALVVRDERAWYEHLV